MDKYLSGMVIGFVALLGMAAGAAAHTWWMHRVALAKRRVPRESAIAKRALVNSRERLVWRWLMDTFREHHVMVKMPVTRFTTPVEPKDREQWFTLLSDVYCTFTVVAPDGKVIGCVDVPGPAGISQSNLLIKRKLFTRCDLPYRLIDADKLPSDQDIFTSFVRAEDEVKVQMDALEAAVSAGDLDRARADLRATVLRQRNTKGSGRVLRGYEEGQFVDSILTPDWAPDSFNAPLDSRQSDLS